MRIFLSRPDRSAEQMSAKRFPQATPASCPLIDTLTEQIDRFLEGENINFSLTHIGLEICSPFQRAVLLAEYDILRGNVSTYGLIAARIGADRGARAVGHALAENPFPIVIPCHRAIRTDRTLGGYQGGLPMKRHLLSMEGIPFDQQGRVSSRAIVRDW